MAPPTQPAGRRNIAFTTRFSLDDDRWIRGLAEAGGCSQADVVRQLSTDQRTLFGLPQNVRHRLERDRSDRSLREYLAELLLGRFVALECERPPRRAAT